MVAHVPSSLGGLLPDCKRRLTGVQVDEAAIVLLADHTIRENVKASRG
jgi:hypothetical protein